MILSKATSYGIRALAYLARHAASQPCGLRKIAEAEQIPPLYLGKLLGELRRHRLVRSSKGIYGGYTLAKPAQAISLWEVYQVLDTNADLDECILGRGACRIEAACPLHEEWHELRKKLVKRKTIAQLATAPVRPAPPRADSGFTVTFL
jgi:Rrf2 family protein